MNSPITIAATNFQAAWAEAVQRLSENKWDLWNLIVQIDNPEIVDNAIHKTMRSYCQENGLIGPDQVAYTIFPYKLFHPGISRQKLYNGYWRYFNGLHLSDYSTWRGTYFERMIRYKPVADNDEPTSQEYVITNNDVDDFTEREIADSFSIADDLEQNIKKIFGL